MRLAMASVAAQSSGHRGLSRGRKAVNHGPYPCRERPAARYVSLSAASPLLPQLRWTGRGSKKTVPKDHSKPRILLIHFGAGDGIRTHDPNLGKDLPGSWWERSESNRHSFRNRIFEAIASYP